MTSGDVLIVGAGIAGAALIRGLPIPQRIADFGLTAEMLTPARSGRGGVGAP